MLNRNNFLKLVNENLGKILGGFLGLLVALILMAFGFWRGLFVLLCVGIGIYLGAREEKNQVIQNYLEKLWFKRERD
ncbi:MAG: DUF2273 domain-containing protein [Firmicutes bacterium]|nr:DUF2273 domain-containing protein [Bacillota bacterium]